jgi:type I restriction enzyme S subunit
MAVPKLRFKADNGSNYPELTVAKLDDLCEKIGDGLHGTPIYSQTGNYYFINGNNLENGKIIVSSDTPKVNDSVFEKNNKELNDSTILMSINGTIGKVAYYNNEKVMLGKSVAYFKVNYKCIKEYCYQLIQTANVQFQFQKGLTGSTIKNLGLNTIKNTNVKVPCLPEQQKIAEFLSTIDTVIAKQKETVSAWEERKKGVMQKLFSQEVRFKADDGSEFPDWEKKKLEDVVEFLDGQRKPLEAGQRVSGKYPYYGASGIIDYVENYIFDEELILLSEDGANILDRNYRVCFLAKGKYWVNNHAHVLRAMDGNVNGFICEQLESFDYRKYNSGGAQPKLNQATCRAIIMNIPCLEEQQKIADCLSSLDDVIEKQKATLAAWEEMKKGLLQQMFV